MAKLTEEQVYAIRAAWDDGYQGKSRWILGDTVTYAEAYGISPSHFSMIGRRKRWASLSEKAT